MVEGLILVAISPRGGICAVDKPDREVCLLEVFEGIIWESVLLLACSLLLLINAIADQIRRCHS